MNSQILISMTVEELQELIKTSVKQCLNEANQKKQEKELLSFKETCEYLGCSRSALNSWKAAGKIPYKRMGKRVFFSKSEVTEAMKESNYAKLQSLN